MSNQRQPLSSFLSSSRSSQGTPSWQSAADSSSSSTDDSSSSTSDDSPSPPASSSDDTASSLELSDSDGSAVAASAPQLIGDPIIVDKSDLAKYVGQPPFTSDKIYTDVTPAGVVMGLAWTAMGGNSLYVEAARVMKGEGKGTVRCTGVCLLSDLLLALVHQWWAAP